MITNRVHVVAAGDTLAKIAASYYGDAGRYLEIARANALLSPYRIYPGQKLLVPVPVTSDDPLRPITVTATRVAEPGAMPVPTFEEIEVTATRLNPWLLLGALAAGLYLTRK